MTLKTVALATALLAVIATAGPLAAAKTSVHPEVPAELEQWSFLIGEWKMDSRRYSLDGPVIEENKGQATFSLTLDGLRIQEIQSTTMAGRPMLVLNVFAFHPDRKEWEIARTDSLHHSFNVMRGAGSEESIVLFERNPRPDQDVSRRVTYQQFEGGKFSRLLEFSLDDGETWVRRNETIYTRGD